MITYDLDNDDKLTVMGVGGDCGGLVKLEIDEYLCSEGWRVGGIDLVKVTASISIAIASGCATSKRPRLRTH